MGYCRYYCRYYGVSRKGGARQSHDGYQLLLGERILLFYGWNRGSHPPQAPLLSRLFLNFNNQM